MIILNEREYAENCLKENVIDSKKPFRTLSILAKYYYNEGYRRKKISKLLIEFMDKNLPCYNFSKTVLEDAVEKIAKNAGKYRLHEINNISVTSTELNTISKINGKVLKRLAFTLLCLAKLGNMRNDKNNGWVNNPVKEVFSLARISCKSTDRYKYLNKLYQDGLLEFPKRLENLSCRVTFINLDGENVLSISDFRELGYEYMNYLGENFTKCQECGRLIKNNKYQNRKYCFDCVGYIPKMTKVITCIDCGKEFVVRAKNTKSVRCKECQDKHRKESKRRWKRKRSKSRHTN